MERLVKFRRELGVVTDGIEELRKKYQEEVNLICACEFPPTLKTFLATAAELSEKNRPYCKPWFLLDRDGWPIELVEGRRVINVARILVQNLRKVV